MLVNEENNKVREMLKEGILGRGTVRTDDARGGQGHKRSICLFLGYCWNTDRHVRGR